MGYTGRKNSKVAASYVIASFFTYGTSQAFQLIDVIESTAENEAVREVRFGATATEACICSAALSDPLIVLSDNLYNLYLAAKHVL